MLKKGFFRPFLIRTLKVDILTLFLALNVVIFSFVMTFSYLTTYKSILEYSKGTIERNGSIIFDRIQFLGMEAEKTLTDTKGLFILNPTIAVADQQLLSFMQYVIKSTDDLSAFFVGTPSGVYIGVINLTKSQQTHYKKQTNKPLPPNTVYLSKLVDIKKTHNQEVWYYQDKDFHILDSEVFDKAFINVPERPWYQQGLKSQQLSWTGLYSHAGSEELGLTAVLPIIKNGELTAVAGADISLTGLAKYLSQKRVGKNGQAFIINEMGQVVIPAAENPYSKAITQKTVVDAYQYFKTTGKNSFTFESEDKRYLAHVNSLPVNFGKDWLLAVVVPFADFFSGLIRTQFIIMAFTALILLISSFVIVLFSKRISTPIVALAKEIDKIKNLELDSKIKVRSQIVEIILMNFSIASMRTALRSFERYVPKEVVKKLMKQGKDIKLNVEKKEVTIFFSDIENFTTITESLTPEQLMPLLSAYFDGMSKIILANQGTIDKYIGDSIMAFWNAPMEIKNHAEAACITALQCQNYLKKFNQELLQNNHPEFKTRFGINTGWVMVGNIGTLERMNYTLIGDAVNIAARLQVTDKYYHLTIIISEFVFHQIDNKFLVRPLDVIAVKGKKIEIKIYELVGSLASTEEMAPKPEEIELCQKFTTGYELFHAGKLGEARQYFEELRLKFPQDFPTQLYLERIDLLLSAETP